MEPVSTPPRSLHMYSRQLGLWFVVCNFSSNTPRSKSELKISAAGKYIRAHLDNSDVSPQQLVQRAAAEKAIP